MGFPFRWFSSWCDLEVVRDSFFLGFLYFLEMVIRQKINHLESSVLGSPRFAFGVAMFCFRGRQVLITLCDVGSGCTLGDLIRRIFQLLMRGRIAAPNLGSL